MHANAIAPSSSMPPDQRDTGGFGPCPAGGWPATLCRPAASGSIRTVSSPAASSASVPRTSN
jgi:hypothetical protein